MMDDVIDQYLAEMRGLHPFSWMTKPKVGERIDELPTDLVLVELRTYLAFNRITFCHLPSIIGEYQAFQILANAC